MYKGVVKFEADVRHGTAIRFPPVAFECPVVGVEKVEIEALLGEEANSTNTIKTTVHLHNVPAQSNGLTIARAVTTNALNRLAFNHRLSIGTPRCTDQTFEPLEQGGTGSRGILAGTATITISVGKMKPILGMSAEAVKASLEEKAPAGEDNYGLFRSACQSESPTEEFMHFYLIILMLCEDDQQEVDKWIKANVPTVSETPTGIKKRMETVYTRLRNEFGHKRPEVDLDETKKEMASHLGGLRELARIAIQSKP